MRPSPVAIGSSLLLVTAVALGACGSATESDDTDDGAGATPASNACPDQIAAGADLGITAIDASLGDSYGRVFCKYTEVLAPNGGPIRLFAQREISNDQLVHARGLLEFFLESVPGSRYGADKTAVANSMADNGAALLIMKGHDGEFDLGDMDGIDGQALYEDETVVTGSDWYINNVFDGHRDASFEEILHLVHDYGIGVDVDWAPPGAAPEYQSHIRAAQINALEEDRTWAQDERAADWIEELRAEGSLTQEYIASVVDSYYGLWGPFTESEGGMWGLYDAKTREEIAEKDPLGYELMEMFFSPYLTYEARLPETFSGTFVMAFDPEVPYTHKSRYLTRVSLTGDTDAAVQGNDADNQLRGNGGDNRLDGAGGTDTAVFTGARADYEITQGPDEFTVSDTVEGRDGSDTLVSIEQVRFADGVVPAADLTK